MSKCRHNQFIKALFQKAGQLVVLGLVEPGLVKIVHIQANDIKLVETQIGRNLQRPVSNRTGIENTVADVGGESNIRAIVRKRGIAYIGIATAQVRGRDFGLEYFKGSVFNERKGTFDSSPERLGQRFGQGRAPS